MLLAAAAPWAELHSGTGPSAGNTFVTTSTTHTQTIHTTARTVEVDDYLTRLTARLDGGPLIYDHTFPAAFSDPIVQAAILQAKQALATAALPHGVTITCPNQLSNSKTLTSSTQNTVVNSTTVTIVETLEIYFGPQTIHIGPDKSVPSFLGVGQTDYNVNDAYQTDIFQTTTTTNTYLIAQTYELDGTSQPGIYSIETFPIPLPGTPHLRGISENGEVVGWTSVGPRAYGFYKRRGSPAVPVTAPGDNTGFTGLYDVNDPGTIVGAYIHFDGVTSTEHGLILRDGRFTTFDYPGPVSTTIAGTNQRGDLVGAEGSSVVIDHAFIYRDGTFTTFLYQAMPTFGEGIDNQGDAVGIGTDGSGNHHGFVRWNTGTFEPIEFPGAVSTIPSTITQPGMVAGQFVNGASETHGFFYDTRSHRYQQFDVPGAAQTFVGGMNNEGDVVGHYIDFGGNDRPFIATPRGR
jgi:hypothetical protein